MQVKKPRLELDMEQQTGSKLRKEYIKAVYCHPAYLTYIQDIIWNARLDKVEAGVKIVGRNMNNLRYAVDITLMAESEEELKSLLMKVKEESEKVGSTFRKLRSWHLVPSLLETVTDFIFLGSKITADVDCSHEIKDPCSLEEKLWPT